MALKQTGGVVVNIDPKEWYKLKTELDAVDPKLTSALRKRVKNAGNVAADEVRKTLRLPNPSGKGDDDGKQALIAATRVTIGFSARTAGAKIVTSSSGLDDKHKGLLLVYNKETFRHPVFETNRQNITRVFARGGDTVSASDREASGELAPWVVEKGRPYFGAVISKLLNTTIYNEIFAAFNDAIAQLPNGTL